MLKPKDLLEPWLYALYEAVQDYCELRHGMYPSRVEITADGEIGVNINYDDGNKPEYIVIALADLFLTSEQVLDQKAQANLLFMAEKEAEEKRMLVDLMQKYQIDIPDTMPGLRSVYTEKGTP